MQSFDFFGLVLGESLLHNTNNLSRTLQKKNLSAAEGQLIMEQTKWTLMSIRNDDSFKLSSLRILIRVRFVCSMVSCASAADEFFSDLFWERVNSMASDLDISDPVFPWRKVPRRYVEGHAPLEYPSTPKDMYRRVYFEALDLHVIFVKKNLSTNLCRRLRRLVVSYKGETSLHFVVCTAAVYGPHC